MRRLALVLCALGLAVTAAPAGATAATSTFAFTGAEQTYTVPAGVGSLHVVAIGAGGGSTLGAPGGSGASVSGDIAVTPGEVLYVEVGMGGGAGGTLSGAPGGGSSDVRTCSVSAGCPLLGTALDPRLIVAGGGGGAGAAGGGGRGGDAFPGPAGASPICRPGATGEAGLSGGATGGGGAGCEAGGSGGPPGSGGVAGLEGSPWFGGAGGVTGGGPVVYGGGGGGGGYFGGGGGGSGPTAAGNGSGGGGGSNFGPIGSIFASAAGGAPEVRITPLVADLSITEPALGFAGSQPQQTISPPQLLDVTNAGTAPLVLSALTFAGQDPQDFLLSSDGCLGSIPAGTSCRLGVSFAPQAPGPRSAELVIASNDPSGPLRIGLAGSGGALPQGPPGAQGPAGPQGAAGGRAPATKVTCQVKKAKRAKKVKVTCKVKPAASAAVARLTHGGRTVAHRRLAPGTRRVVFRLTPRDAGPYTLTVTPQG